MSGVKLTAWQDTAGKWSSVLQTGSSLGTAIHFPRLQPTFPGAPQVRRVLGHLTATQNLAWHGLKSQCLKNCTCSEASVSETPPNPQRPRTPIGAALTGRKRKSGTRVLAPRDTQREKVITSSSCACSLRDTNAVRQSHSALAHCRGKWAHGWREAPLLCQSSGCSAGG